MTKGKFNAQRISKLASNIDLERLNREFKRRSDLVQSFPNDESVVRLVGAIIMEQQRVAGVEKAGAERSSLTLPRDQNDSLPAKASGRRYDEQSGRRFLRRPLGHEPS